MALDEDGDEPIEVVVDGGAIICLPAELLTTNELSAEARILAALHYVHRRTPGTADIEEAFGEPAVDLQYIVDELDAWPRYQEYL